VRVDLLSVGPAYDRAAIRFHARLTVVGGLDGPARAEFAELMVRALSGGADDELWGARWIDTTGEPYVGESDGRDWSWTTTDGTPTVDPAAILGLDDRALRRLMVLAAADLIPPAVGAVEGANPELDEARAAFAAFDAVFTDALAMGAKVDALRAEVADIDERLRAADADQSRRRYAAMAAELGTVRMEAASLRGGATVTEADLRCIAATDDIRKRAERWRRARAALRTEWARWGDRERLDARTLAEALAAPDQVPPELDALSRRYEAAEAAHVELTAALNRLATGALAPPSHPAVVRLAHAKQEEVWAAARRAVAAAGHLEHQSLALGGLQAEGVSPAAASDLEDAHDAVDLAVRNVAGRRVPGLIGALIGLLITLIGLISFPLLIALGVVTVGATAVWAVTLPKRELARCQALEADALQRAGVASYITFQMRRLEVNIDPKATEPLELAALEYRRAITGWRKFAGDLPASEAIALEGETRAYANALAGSRGAADEIAQVRDRLSNVAEPAVAAARAALLTACRPFGIDDPKLAVELVRHQAGIGGLARLQAALEQSERDEAAKRADLDSTLNALGFAPKVTSRAGPDDAEIERCLHAFEQARVEAEQREAARRRARPAAVIESDLARLEAMVAAERLPEWGDAELDGLAFDVDVDALRARRAHAVAEYEAAYRSLPDIGRMTDRREALERRVGVLTNGVFDEAALDLGEIQQVLLGRLAAARRVGPAGESVTVVFDEPFERIHGDRKWTLLDVLEKLSASVQLVYLTDDVDVLVWARRRASRGTVSLLEPAHEFTDGS
jgi:hypothetical protein